MESLDRSAKWQWRSLISATEAMAETVIAFLLDLVSAIRVAGLSVPGRGTLEPAKRTALMRYFAGLRHRQLLRDIDVDSARAAVALRRGGATETGLRLIPEETGSDGGYTAETGSLGADGALARATTEELLLELRRRNHSSPPCATVPASAPVLVP